MKEQPLDYKEIPRAERRDEWEPVWHPDYILATLYGLAGLIVGIGGTLLYLGVA